MWILAAACSALFAGVTSILVKCGIKHADSDVATAIRTGVVLVFAWIVTFISGSAGEITALTLQEIIFITLSGLATGASWIFCFRALSLASASKVAAIDKSSTILTVICAIIFFGETQNLYVKLACVAAIFIGTLLMIDYKKPEHAETANAASGRIWIVYAVLSAVFAAMTSIFAKVGMKNVNSNLATALRTGVVLVFAWAIVFARKKQAEASKISGKELGFILVSGITTGASWICYYYAVKFGTVSVVVPIDKLSIAVTVAFSVIFLKERLSVKAWIGFFVILVSTLIMAIFC